jgi:hypothetical protein
MASLKVKGCKIDTQSTTIFFSEAVDQNSASQTSNYEIFAANSGLSNQPPNSVFPIDDRTVAITAPTNVSFSAGEWVRVTVNPPGAGNPIKAVDGTVMETQVVSGQVPDEAARANREADDVFSYPALTEEISYRPSPVGQPTGGGGGSISTGGGSNLGQVAIRAVSDVLGWKPNSSDPKGFLGALTQSFNLTDVEGHVESKWMPRSYAVQTDLGGGITGAQASLYARAKDALDQSLTLLDGLYPLDPEADPEYVKALREMARSQMTEIVKEFGTVGLPSILRIDTYFKILLGQHPSHQHAVQFEPDKIGGTLGKLRDTYGIYFRGNKFNNSIEDEQDITNFRVISDYMTSLMQSWIANRDYFVVAPGQPAFFGTQLVLISRQLNVIAETVDEVRFTLDSVFIGPNERQSLLLKFKDRSLHPMFLEDMLVEIEQFVSEEGPRLLRDGGKISVTNNILPVVESFERLVQQAHDPQHDSKVPKGYRTSRVQRSLDDLHDQLRDLARLIKQIEQEVPQAEDKLAIDSVLGVSLAWDYEMELYTAELAVVGSGIDADSKLAVQSPVVAIEQTLTFYSSERIDVSLTFGTGELSNGYHDITVTTPDGESATLLRAFQWNETSKENATLVANGVALTLVNGLPPVKSGKTASGTKSDTASSQAAAKPAGATPGATKTQTPAVPLSDRNIAPEVPPPVVEQSAQVPGDGAKSGGSAGDAPPTRDQIAEMIEKHHPTLWEKVKKAF